jgi:hypothetical protein
MSAKQPSKKNPTASNNPDPDIKEAQSFGLEIQKLRLEENKAWFDFHKHMTTLNTGVIVIVATLVENVFVDMTSQSFQLIATSFYAFLGSIMLSVIGLGYHMPSIRLVRTATVGTGTKKVYFSLKYVQVFLLVTSLTSFLAGIFYFVAFSLSNASLR